MTRMKKKLFTDLLKLLNSKAYFGPNDMPITDDEVTLIFSLSQTFPPLSFVR